MGCLSRRGIAFAGCVMLIVATAACGHVKLHKTEELGGGCEACAPEGSCDAHAKVCETPTVHALASDLDHLEKHIDWYGSVVAKVPDVWGQARLTQYREEFEKEMAAEQTTFKTTLSGSLSRSDQAYFAHATTLAIAAQPKPPLIGRNKSEKTIVPPAPADVVEVSRTEETIDKVGDKSTTTKKTFEQPKTPAPAKEPEPEKVELPKDLPKTTDLISDPSKGDVITRTQVKLRDTGFKAVGDKGLSIEPELMLAQKARYLDFLNQLRRTNEGDDKADGPGYSLNLMRIPVSVFPGKRTDEGHGAEITFTVDPILGDDLLPVTFRRMVVNDLLHQLGFTLTQVLDDEETRKLLDPDTKDVIEGYQILHSLSTFNGGSIDKLVKGLTREDRRRLTAALNKLTTQKVNEDVSDLVDAAKQVVTDMRHYARLKGFECGTLPEDPGVDPCIDNRCYEIGDSKVQPDGKDKQEDKDNAKTKVLPRRELMPNLCPRSLIAGSSMGRRLSNKLRVPSLSFSNGVSNKLGYPTSQIFDVLGEGFAFEIAFGAYRGLEDTIKRQKYAHLPDVQAYLREEATAAYQFLAEPGNQHLWTAYCTPQLVEAVRSRQLAKLEDMRDQFRCDVERISQTGEFRRKRPDNELIQHSKTAALAWAILVDSALLTDKLVKDMKETASSKGKPCPNAADVWLPYYLPNPPPEARCAFNAYVKMRWPVYVFALDPNTQDQNIADALSTRRETQLALAVAFTNGQIGVNTLTRYARRLEAEYETVALNRTQVGFSHGENVFGWRFYPRFQTPDTESNLKVLLRDQLIGGPSKNALLRQRRLEPGPRECVAVVVMPSFVPYVTVDSVSNWFGLANPKHKVLDHTQAVRLSKTVRTLQNCEHKVTDAECYRDGELRRLQQRVEQLANRLPMQTQTVPVPILNTLGGFEMFSNGATDLAPELYGWYGAPGVSSAKATTLFLVGDHFSPLRSMVIVGNREIPKVSMTMLSRQVMQVTVPAGVMGVEDKDRKGVFAQAHVATPYGVTRELLIPLIDAKPAADPGPKAGYTLGGGKIVVTYQACVEKGELVPVFKNAKAEKLDFTWFDPTGAAPETVQVRFEFEVNKIPLPVPCVCSVEADLKTGERKVVFDPTAITTIGKDLLQQLGKTYSATGSDGTVLTGSLKSKKVKVKPVPGLPGHAVAEVDANGELEVEFKPIGCCSPEEPKKCQEAEKKIIPPAAGALPPPRALPAEPLPSPLPPVTGLPSTPNP